MGLDACVYCDCYRKGLVNVPLRYRDRIDDSYDGSLNVKSPFAYADDENWLEYVIGFDNWKITACKHENGWLVKHWLGNAGSVGCLREYFDELQKRSKYSFPIITEQVIYSGTHGEDKIRNEEVAGLKAEILQMPAAYSTAKIEMLREVAHFRDQMLQLIAAAEETGNSIVF